MRLCFSTGVVGPSRHFIDQSNLLRNGTNIAGNRRRQVDKFLFFLTSKLQEVEPMQEMYRGWGRGFQVEHFLQYLLKQIAEICFKTDIYFSNMSQEI
jgi:hypothetical protein